MHRIISHIEYLLDHHDCVTIPAVGAFIVHRENASIDHNKGAIKSPQRVITFNSELTHDDGAIASSYARTYGIPYTKALSMVGIDVELIKATLADTGSVNIGAIGTLIKNASGNLEFLPGDSLFTSLGYADIELRPISTLEQEPIENPIMLEAPSAFSRTMRTVMKYAAMIVVLITVGIVLTTPVTDNNGVDYASLNPAELIIEPIQNDDLTPTPQLSIIDPASHIEQLSVEPSPEHFKYCLVIASLANAEQADKFVSQVGPVAKGVIESNGRYRVYALTGMTVASVLDDNILARFPDAWPCEAGK